MIKRFFASPAAFLVFILVYMVALAAGILVACIFTFRSNDNLIEIAGSDAEYYVETGRFIETAVVFQTSCLVYDEKGTAVDSQMIADSTIRFDRYAAKYIPEIREEGLVYRLIVSTGLPSRLAIVIGLPVKLDTGDAFYFFVKDMRSLHTIIVVLFSALTPMLFLTMLFSFFLRKRDKELLRVQRDYVANMSHDLKSPVSAIKALAMNGYEGLVHDEETIRRYSAMILEEADQLERTVFSMLELARIQSGQKDMTKSEIAATELLTPILKKYIPYCNDLDITVTADIPELPVLCTNQHSVTQIFDILLDNAMKFAGSGGNIHLSAKITGKTVIFSVKDDGIGISEENQKHIFERFYQGDVSHNEKGSGLGLAIAQELARSLDETIWVVSAPGKGAEFSFTVHSA